MDAKELLCRLDELQHAWARSNEGRETRSARIEGIHAARLLINNMIGESFSLRDRAALDRSKWESGAWDSEPDFDEWQYNGIECRAVRNHRGAWCGYVIVPPGHAWHGTKPEIDRAEVAFLWSWSTKELPGQWWAIGFDCGHSGQLAPGDPGLDIYEHYCTLPEVRRIVEQMAEQAARPVHPDAPVVG